MRHVSLLLMPVIAANLAACINRIDVQCVQDSDCNQNVGGVCARSPIADHKWCAYPDLTCGPSGLRYSKQEVGDGVAGACVASSSGVDAGIDATLDAPRDAPRDGSEIDGNTACMARVVFVDGPPPVFVGQVPGRREVWVANTDGSGLVNLSNNASADDTSPSWSPSGTRLAFASNRAGKFDVFVVNVDGTGMVNLTSALTADATNPIWSPDGTHIAFITQGKVWTMNANGAAAAVISTRTQTNDLAWSPTSNQLVFGSLSPNTPALYVITVGDGSPEIKLNPGAAFESGARWAPAQKITFSSGSDILTVNGNGTNLTNVTQNTAGGNKAPVTSNDGSTIAFSSIRDGGFQELWSIPAVGGAAVQITHHTIAHGGDIASDISSDGKLVAYTRTVTTVNGSETSTVTQVGVIGIDGSNERLFNVPHETNGGQATFSSCP